MTHVTGVVCEPPAQRDYPPEPAPPRRTQDALVRHHQPQQQQQQQQQPRQRNTQQQHAQTVHGSTTKTMRHNPADERDNGGAATARPVVDEAAERHKVRKDSGGSRGEGSATSLNPKTLPRVSGNHDRSAPRDRDRTHQPLSGPHRVLRNALQRGDRESRTRLHGPLNAPCGDETPEGGSI